MDIFACLEQQNIVLTQPQRQAVLAQEPAVLLLAVPGAGKTTTLAARVAHLMASGQCLPQNMLNLTFNREAAADMHRRFAALFGGLWPEEQFPRFSTIHSFCYRLLQSYAADRGTRLPRLLEEGEQRRLVLELYREKTGEYLTEEHLAQLINGIGYCTNMMYGEADCRRIEGEIRGLGEVRSDYHSWKRENHAMDFDDMLFYALQVLRRQPARTEALRRRYTHLHLDEAQDASLLQHTIIRALAPAHLFYVGDEDQSIYGFRGACPQALLDFEKTYPGARLLKTEENFRSGQAIVRAAGHFIAGNRHRFEKTMIPACAHPAEVTLLDAGQAHLQYPKTADCLEQLPAGERAAVLYRGGLSAAAMADALMRRGIPFALRDRRFPLLQDTVARDVLALVRLALDPGDGQAFLRIYHKLGCYIGRDAARRAAESGAPDLWQWLADGEDFPGKSTARLSFLRSFFRRMRGWEPTRVIDRLVLELDYIETVERRGESGYAGEAAAHKLAALRSVAEGCADLAAFADRLAGLDSLIDSCARPDAAVTLSTVHSAKGREFDRVWLVDLFDGVFPGGPAVEENLTGSDLALEEEARLFYVAVTRAKTRLTLCTAGEFCGYELLTSRFVPRLLEQEDASASAAAFLALGVRRGTRLSHRAFGFGTVEEVNTKRELFTVHFGKLGRKTFSLASLRQGDIFRIL